MTYIKKPILRHHICPKCERAHKHNNGISVNLIEFQNYNMTTGEVLYRASCIYHECDIEVQSDKTTLISANTSRLHTLPEKEWKALVEFVDDGIID